MRYLKHLLWPLALLYGLIVVLRNWTYDRGYARSIAFDFPVIAVGNLSVGGTGKTPHVEYLIRILAPHFKLGLLSRGYLRKTTGYTLADANATAETVGDEPMLIKLKYPMVDVVASADRALAIPQMINDIPGIQAILMDDGMQHRPVDPGMTIMITDYNNLFTDDFLLPVGTLREPKSAAHRAQIVVVSKCPMNITEAEKVHIRKKISPKGDQAVFFSYLRYDVPYSLANNPDKLQPDNEMDILLVCGIANPQPLVDHLTPLFKNVYLRDFPDHHAFTQSDMESITTAFLNTENEKKALIITEKDAVRFYRHKNWILLSKLPIFVQPVQVEFFPESKQLFDREVLQYMQRVTTKLNDKP